MYGINKVWPHEADELVKNEWYQILDVRSKEEYDQGHIKKAISFPWSSFEENMHKLLKHGKYIVYCNAGNRSGLAAQKLAENDFENVALLDGGLDKYREDHKLVTTQTDNYKKSGRKGLNKFYRGIKQIFTSIKRF